MFARLGHHLGEEPIETRLCPWLIQTIGERVAERVKMLVLSVERRMPDAMTRVPVQSFRHGSEAQRFDQRDQISKARRGEFFLQHGFVETRRGEIGQLHFQREFANFLR
jgi:hypothetical protein